MAFAGEAIAMRSGAIDRAVMTWCKDGMPTPLYSFRLPREEAANLKQFAKLFGAKDTSAFLREMIGSICSGDAERIKAFNMRLFARMGEQLTLQLTAAASAEVEKVHAKALRSAKRVRRARR